MEIVQLDDKPLPKTALPVYHNKNTAFIHLKLLIILFCFIKLRCKIGVIILCLNWDNFYDYFTSAGIRSGGRQTQAL